MKGKHQRLLCLSLSIVWLAGHLYLIWLVQYVFFFSLLMNTNSLCNSGCSKLHYMADAVSEMLGIGSDN